MLRKNVCGFIILQIFLLLLQVNSAGAQQLYHKDLEITESQFVSVYNAALDLISQKTGRNCNDLKINPKNIYVPNEVINYEGEIIYDCKRCKILPQKNSKQDINIYGVMIVPNYDPYALANGGLQEEVLAMTMATAWSKKNFSNLINAVDIIFKTPKKWYATSVDGLMLYYNTLQFHIMAEENNVTKTETEKRIAKRDGYWYE